MGLSVIDAAHRSQLQDFERTILAKQAQIESWFRAQWRQHRPPFYGSDRKSVV